MLCKTSYVGVAVTLGAAVILAAGAGCSRSGSAPAENKGADPVFDSRWSSLAADGVEALYIEDDQAQGLMGSVRRAAKPLPPASGAAVSDSKEPLPEQPPGMEVQRIVRSYLPAVKTCYMTMTRAGVVRSGKAIVSFAIDPGGKVVDPKVDAPNFSGTALPGCVVGQVSRWMFPRSQKGSGSFSYPFVFVAG